MAKKNAASGGSVVWGMLVGWMLASLTWLGPVLLERHRIEAISLAPTPALTVEAPDSRRDGLHDLNQEPAEDLVCVRGFGDRLSPCAPQPTDDASEEVWFKAAQQLANEIREPIAVVQGTRYVALIRPAEWAEAGLPGPVK